jgi:hypothetical protein
MLALLQFLDPAIYLETYGIEISEVGVTYGLSLDIVFMLFLHRDTLA